MIKVRLLCDGGYGDPIECLVGKIFNATPHGGGYEVELGDSFPSNPLLFFTQDEVAVIKDLNSVPVDFVTAINSGRLIQSEFWNDSQVCDTSDKSRDYVLNSHWINGKWFILDEVEEEEEEDELVEEGLDLKIGVALSTWYCPRDLELKNHPDCDKRDIDCSQCWVEALGHYIQ